VKPGEDAVMDEVEVEEEMDEEGMFSTFSRHCPHLQYSLQLKHGMLLS
jgi:hypothetical protein